MKPAEIATAVISIPVVAAFLVSTMIASVDVPAPAKAAVETSAAATQNVAEEIVVVARRASADSAT
jgi:enamine deaminase RidA (YjgF/YER057c/UK114 family)